MPRPRRRAPAPRWTRLDPACSSTHVRVCVIAYHAAVPSTEHDTWRVVTADISEKGRQQMGVGWEREKKTEINRMRNLSSTFLLSQRHK